MLKRYLAAVSLAVITAATGAATGAASHAAAPFKLSPKEYIPVSEIRPGMTGYGLTVFKGVKISKFGVKVVGVMPQGDMGRPLVLVMLSGGPITQRKANLIQGMSGSPIYIKGRLLGAFALGEQTGREPLGMVRPIDQMIDAFDPRLPSRPVFDYTAAGPNPLQPFAATPFATTPFATTPFAGLPGFPDVPDVATGDLSAATDWRPAPLAVTGTGLGLRSLATLNAWLRPLGMQASSMPGGAGDLPAYFPKNVPLVPGASLAVSLMQGDVDMTAVGTVTYRRGDRILGFGHPWTSFGAVDFPMSTAYVHDVFSSIVVSHKYASPIETVGSITQDGPFSVAGVLHRNPTMVPMRVRVEDDTTGRVKVFHVRMVRHPLLLPGLTLAAAQEVIDRVRTFPGDSMANVSFTIVPDGLAPIKRTNTFYDLTSISTASLSDLTEALVMLSRNPFQPIGIKSLDVNVRIISGHKTATVERAWVEKDKVEPGDTVTVQAVIKPYKRPSETKMLRVKIPENAPAGQAQVVVFGGLTGFGRPTAGPAPATGSPATATTSVSNVKQLVAKFEEREQNNEIGVRVLLPGTAVSVDGERLNRLPDPLADVMKSTKASSTRLERDDVRYAEKVPYILAGSQILVINIERKNSIDKSTASPSTTATTTTTAAVDESDDSTDDSAAAAGDPDGEPMLASAGFRVPVASLARNLVALATAKPEETKGSLATDAKPSTSETAAKPADEKPAETTSTEKTDTTAEKTDDTDKDAKGPGRIASLWKQTGKTQFDAGKQDDVTVNSHGNVQVTAALKRLAETTRPYIWSLLPLADGSVLAGTGNAGEVLRVTPEGRTSVFARTDDLEVHALAEDKQGNIYAGTMPNGHIVKITPDGKATTFYDTKEKYVLALAFGPDGNLYAGTGPDAKVFVVSPQGAGRELIRLPESHVLSLAVAKDGSLLAGTAPDGLVYRVAPDGKSSVAYDAPEGNVTAVATDGAGDVFAATAPKGKLYKVLPDGRADTLLDNTDGSIMAIVAMNDGVVYVAGGKKLYRVATDKTVTTLDNEDQNQLVSLAVGPDGTMYAGSANTGVVYKRDPRQSGTFLSSVHDADLRAAWGHMESDADVPEGAKVEIQTRSGNVAQPDATWSDWSAPVAVGADAQVMSPPARYLQYRATLSSAPSGASPVLRWVSVRYLTDNRPPSVKFTDPKEGDHWSGKKTVKWTGSDPDSDLLNYTLFLSSDNGATWKPLKDATGEAKGAGSTPAITTEPAKPTTSPAEDAAKAKKDAETLKSVSAELDKYDNLSPEMKAAVLQTATSAIKGTKDTSASTESGDKAENTSKSSYSWDTSSLPDGTYRLKVVASDKASNPGNPLTAQDFAGPVVISNSKPAVTIDASGPAVGADKAVTLRGEARSPSAAILRVSYRIDKGDWQAALPADGIFDSPQETWSLTTDPLDKGEHTIEVRASDEVDNTGSATTKVTIP